MNPFYLNYIQSMTPEDWEFFAIDYLSRFGFSIISPPARGADGGKDGIVEKDNNRYIVSCKLYSPDKAISPSIEQSILDRIIQHGANGFIGFYSTSITQALSDRFKGIQGEGYHIILLDIYAILEDINIIPSVILDKYGTAANIKFPLNVDEENYQPLICLNQKCSTDILLEEHINNSFVEIYIDSYNKLNYIYGCKDCFPNHRDWCWAEISQILHLEQLLKWNSIVERSSQKYNLSPDFYRNKDLFNSRIQKRLIKLGTWI